MATTVSISISHTGRAGKSDPPRQLARHLGIDLSPSDLARVDQAALARVARLLKDRPDLMSAPSFTWDDPMYWLVDAPPSSRAQYFATGAAVNFRFWRVSAGRVVPAHGSIDGSSFTGAMYMWRCLRRAVERQVPVLDARFLADLTLDDYDLIFSDDTGRNPLTVAAGERMANLRDFGHQLQTQWGGSFWQVVQASEGNLVNFSRLSRGFRAFDDPLFKLTMLNVILHTGAGLCEFDHDPLPAIDYHLTKQMVRHGVVVPAPRLHDKMIRRRLLTAAEAFELRRATLIAFLDLSDQTGVAGHKLDNLWWSNRRNCLDELPVCTDPALAERCPFLTACTRLTNVGMPLERTRYY